MRMEDESDDEDEDTDSDDGWPTARLDKTRAMQTEITLQNDVVTKWKTSQLDMESEH